MNTELLLKVKKHILEEPKRLDMGEWLTVDCSGPDAPACGTVACIAGWAILLAGYQRGYDESFGLAGRRVLEIRHYSQANHLFYTDEWPPLFREDFYRAKRNKQREAEVTAARIDHFIVTKGKE